MTTENNSTPQLDEALTFDSNIPFVPPFRVISECCCGTDAHIVDTEGNIIIESSQWVTSPELKHKKAMVLICDALNAKFPATDKRGARRILLC